MQSFQLPSFGNTCLNIGGGGFGMFNSFMIGGEGGAIVVSSVSNANGEGSLGVGFGMFNIGYAIPSKSRFLMYPLIGMGLGASSLNLRYAKDTKADFTASNYFFITAFNVELYSFENND